MIIINLAHYAPVDYNLGYRGLAYHFASLALKFLTKPPRWSEALAHPPLQTLKHREQALPFLTS